MENNSNQDFRDSEETIDRRDCIIKENTKYKIRKKVFDFSWTENSFSFDDNLSYNLSIIFSDDSEEKNRSKSYGKYLNNIILI